MTIFPPIHPWQASVYAGIAAATVSLAIETPLVWLLKGQLPWAAARMAAAMLLGPSVLSPPTFDFWIVVLAFVIHFSISIFLAFILAWIIHGESLGRAIGMGVVFGIIVFFINMVGLTAIFFPWFAELRNWITFVSHTVLGASLGGAYCLMTHDRFKHEQRTTKNPQ